MAQQRVVFLLVVAAAMAMAYVPNLKLADAATLDLSSVTSNLRNLSDIVSNINMASITGTVFCSLNGNIVSTAVEGVPMVMRCKNVIVAQATTTSGGLFTMTVDDTKLSVSEIITCAVEVVSPIICNIGNALPGAGTAVGTIGNVLPVVGNVVANVLAFGPFGLILSLIITLVNGSLVILPPLALLV